MVLAVGITAGKLVLLSLAAAGVTAVAAAVGPLFLAVKLAGATYLVWLGIGLWRPDPPRSASPTTGSEAGWLTRQAGYGFALAVSNPQAILFYIAVLPSVVDQGSGPLLYLALAATLSAVMAAVAAAYIALAVHARSAAGSPTARRRADCLAGTLLMIAAVLVAIR